MTDPPPESKRARVQADQGTSGDEQAWRTFATFGAVGYALGCCVILPFAFGSWAAFTAAAVFGAPLWLVLILGGGGVAASTAYAATRSST